MKAQTSSLQLAAAIGIGGVIAGTTFAATRLSKPQARDPKVEALNQRIRAGLLTIDDATQKFADNAHYISEARWLLSADPLERWKVAWMGLGRDVNFNKKYVHGFVIVYDENKRPFMALHTMPNDRSCDPLPNAMGDRNCVIDVFPVTMDASAALCEKRGHSEEIGDQLIPLTNPHSQAGHLRNYIEAVREAAFPYTVPVPPVRRELVGALQDASTLTDFNERNQPKAIVRRQRALNWIERRDDNSLAWWLNFVTSYRLGATGFNSNSGAADIMTLLAHKHSFDLIKAPFCDQSMAAEIKRRAEVNLAPMASISIKPHRREPQQSPLGPVMPAFA